MDKLKLILTNVIIALIVFGGLYIVHTISKRNKIIRQKAINNGYAYSKGIITDKHSYKGHSMTIEYKIRNVNYNYSGGWDSNPNNLDVGDSIKFRYSVKYPQYIITELESEY